LPNRAVGFVKSRDAAPLHQRKQSMSDKGNIKPIIMVATGAFIVLVLIPLLINRTNTARMAAVNPHVSIGETSRDSSSPDTPTYRWPNSEVPRSAERLRDVTGVAIASMTYVLEAGIQQHKPTSVDEILRAIARRNLIAPEWLTNEAGVLQMRNGSVYLRYSPNDLSIEILSVPRDRLDGPAFLLRLPDTENVSGSARYFESTHLDGVIYPAAFTPIPQVINSGWQPRLFKQTQLPDVQRAQLEQWAAANTRR
jgi:hypothetical protein